MGSKHPFAFKGLGTESQAASQNIGIQSRRQASGAESSSGAKSHKAKRADPCWLPPAPPWSEQKNSLKPSVMHTKGQRGIMAYSISICILATPFS
ncbi:hypothetical protein V2G26_010244 [Clonostachys chloroleuca]